MTLETLLKKIEMPEEAAEAVLGVRLPQGTREICLGLLDENAYETAYAKISKLLGGEGYPMLRVMLDTALLTFGRYQAEGIGEDVFFATMGCFSRFVKEHLESFGVYGFDRGFWTGRQLSLTLFRLGTLEYEKEKGGAVSVHIPSGADLSEDAVSESLATAKVFFKAHGFPATHYYCTSWLLSPSLQKVLPPTSRILSFQKRFRILRFDEADDEYKLWVFKRKELAAEEFPETTSLQRSIKKFVLAGGAIGSAFGEIIP